MGAIMLAGYVIVTGAALDPLSYCHAVQSNVGFIRYPFGTIGVLSTAAGETADAITRQPRIYPCIGKPELKLDNDDWRMSVSGDPARLKINYRADKPCGASIAQITVTPHVSVFRITFPLSTSSNFVVLDFGKPKVDEWARLNRWTEKNLRRIANTGICASVGEPGKPTAFYAIRFSVPCVEMGQLDAEGKTAQFRDNITCENPRVFASFNTQNVEIAVAVSFRSLEQAETFLATECNDFDVVYSRCRTAWEELLSRVKLDGTESAKRMAYTALYTILANVIDGSDGGWYTAFYSKPRSVASSAYWQFIGGYQSCCWDNVRATYPFLILAFPELMTNVLNTYLARYQKDGYMDGNACLFTGSWGNRSIRFNPVLVAHAYFCGLPLDYHKLYSALKADFSNELITPATLRTIGYLTQPETGGFACSRSLEFYSGFYALGLLAKALGDKQQAVQYLHLSRAYTNLWDSSNKVFRVKSADGTWGPIENVKMTWNPNPQGLFEGTSGDWQFAVPHDPFGLLELPNQADFVQRLVNYCLNDAWFNDYQYDYPYMLYYAGAIANAQQIIRTVWVPLFTGATMYEGVKPKPPHNPWQTHYVGVSGWLICSMLGLYPVMSPPGQFVICSPTITKADIRTARGTLRIRSRNNDTNNLYIREIKLNGRVYPAYFVPAKRLAAGATIELDMCNNPEIGLGRVYIAATDGFIREAYLASPARLACTINAPAETATTAVYCADKPVKLFVNGQKTENWTYNTATKLVIIQTVGEAKIEIQLP